MKRRLISLTSKSTWVAVLAMIMLVLLMAFPRGRTWRDAMMGMPTGSLRLEYAVASNDVEQFRMAIDEGAAIETRNAAGETPLLMAATCPGDPAIVRELLRLGADPNRGNTFGVTPLLIAASLGRLETARLLLDAGADPNARPPGGDPPLIIAARCGDTEFARRLLAGGADANVTDRDQATALEIALAQGDSALAALLSQYGARPSGRAVALTATREPRTTRAVANRG